MATAGAGRLAGGALASGLVGGAAAGFGARLVMYGLRLTNHAFDGSVTHAGFEIGRWTFGGTMSIVIEGMFTGLLGGAVYVLARHLLRGPTWVRGLSFGGVLLVSFGPAVLDGDYEYTRFVSPSVSVTAFGALFLLYGLVVAGVAEWITPIERSGLHPRAQLGGSIVLLLVALMRAWVFAVELRFRYRFS